MPDPVKPSEITSRPPLVDLAPEPASSPALVYIGRDDRIYVRSASLSSAPPVRVSGRLLGADGIIQPFSFEVTPGASAFANRALELAEGYLLAIAAHGIEGQLTIPHQVWVEVGILRGRLADLQIGQVLFRGYLSEGSSLGWPPGRLGGVLEEPGLPTIATGPDPAAGAEAIITVTGNTVFAFTSFRVELVTDATVSDRQVRIEIAAGAVVAWRSEPFAAHPASTSRFYNWAVGGEFAAPVLNGEHNGYIPRAHLLGGNAIRTATVNLQAGDNYGAPVSHRNQWFSG